MTVIFAPHHSALVSRQRPQLTRFSQSTLFIVIIIVVVPSSVGKNPIRPKTPARETPVFRLTLR